MVKDFLNTYADFSLNAGFSKNSANQYKSYLRNACKKVSGLDGYLDMIAADNDANEQAKYAEQMNIEINKALRDDSFPISKKHLRDYKSAILLLIAFVSEKEWVKGKGAVAKPILQSASEYSRKDLRRIFLSRVKTQDRMSYPYGVFAARILCKIASRHKAKLFDRMVDNVKFLNAPDKSKFVYLKDIDKLLIATDGYVYVECKGKTTPVYTEVIKNGKSVGYEKVVVSAMRDLSLDHDIPLYTALEGALNSMPEYKKLSDSVKSYRDANAKLNASDLSGAYWKGEYASLGVCEKDLLLEIGSFINSTKITVMHTPYNSSKSKNTDI